MDKRNPALNALFSFMAVAGIMAVAVPSASAQITIVNSGFETPHTGNATYDPTGAGVGWAFVGLSGVSANHGGFTQQNPNAPEGVQVGFIQKTGSFSQSIIIPQTGTLSLSFVAAQRGFQTSGTSPSPNKQNFEVLIGGTAVGIFQPAGKNYQPFSTDTVNVNPGNLTIQFLGLDTVPGFAGTDETALVDAITTNFTPSTIPSVAPEPGSIALMLTGSLSMAGLLIRRRRVAKG